MKNDFLIRMMIQENGHKYPTIIKAFYFNHINELLKLYITAKENGIMIDIPEENKGHSEFDDQQVFVTDIELSFGGEESITCLDIYVEVI